MKARLAMKASVYAYTKLKGNESTLQGFVKSQAQTGLKLELRGKSKSKCKYQVHVPYKRVFEDKNVGRVGRYERGSYSSELLLSHTACGFDSAMSCAVWLPRKVKPHAEKGKLVAAIKS